MMLRSCVILSALPVALSGCSGSGGGGGPEARNSGVVVIDFVHEPEFIPETFVSGRASFVHGEIASTLEDDGECRIQSFSDVTGRDAGTDAIEITGPNGNFEIGLTELGYYASTDQAAAIWSPSAQFGVTVSGGTDVPGFTGTITTPSDFVLTSPAPANVIDVDKSEDLELAWTSSGGEGVRVRIGDVPAHLICFFDDDGSGTIPSSQLAPATDGLAPLSIWKSQNETLETEFAPIQLRGSITYRMVADLH